MQTSLLLSDMRLTTHTVAFLKTLKGLCLLDSPGALQVDLEVRENHTGSKGRGRGCPESGHPYLSVEQARYRYDKA